jgi:hypothetical protein
VDGPYLLGDVRAAVLDKDGKVRAEKGAQAAVDALGIVEQLGGVVAFGIGPFGHDEHVLGAELDAETAALAPLFDDLNHAAGHLDPVSIQRLSPIAHGLLLRSSPICWLPRLMEAANRGSGLIAARRTAFQRPTLPIV